jgi:hypothetical protein
VKLDVVRRWRTDEATIGTMLIDGEPFAYTLEDPVRAKDDNGDGIIDANEVARVKIPEQTAIPAGTYMVLMHRSPKFGRVPKILDVPGFTDILIHSGNKPSDTAGCVLVGLTRRRESIEQSKVALVDLIRRIEAAEKIGDSVWIEIREAFGGMETFA